MEFLTLAVFVVVLVLVGLAAHFISLGVYRSMIRAGYAYPTPIRVVTFIASLIGILVIAGGILLSTFRFMR